MPARRTRQTRLHFAPAEKRKRNQTDSDSDVPLPTPKKMLRSHNDTPAKRELERSMGLGMPVLQNRHGMFGSSDNEALISDSSSVPLELEKKSKRASVDKKQKKEKNGSQKGKKITEKEKNDKPKDKKGKLKATQNASKKIIALSDGSMSEEAASPRRTRTKKNRPSKPVQLSNDDDDDDDLVLGRQIHPLRLPSESNEEDDIPVTATPRRLTRRKRAATPESSEDEIAPPSTRRRRMKRPVSPGDENNGEAENKQGNTNNKNNKARSRQEVDDLADDMEFLRSSQQADKGRLRSKHPKPMDKKQKLLEQIRRKRAGASAVAEPSSSATPGRRRPGALPDSDSELEIINEEDDDSDLDMDDAENASDISDEVEEISDDDRLAPRRLQTNALDMFQEDGEDEDFVVDDSDGEIGEPVDISAALPIHLSRWRTAKAQELFPIAIEWMVMKKINPAFDSQNDLYRLAFDKLNGEVSALAESKYSSSIWTPDFSRVLRARPHMVISEIGHLAATLGDTGCEACNRKSHHASFNITFTGKPYHTETLEPIAQNSSHKSASSAASSSSSSSSSSSDSELDFDASSNDGEGADASADNDDVDQNGTPIVPESRVFAVGSTCKGNAQMAHLLRHWRWHLNDWVGDYLRHQGYLADKKVVKREKKSTARREKEARRIVRKMESEGEIGRLHRLYKSQVTFAGEWNNEYKGRGRRM